WRVTTGKETASLMIDPPPERRDQTDSATAHPSFFGRDDAWDPQGRRRAIVDGGGIVRIVDAASGRVEATLPGFKGRLPATSGSTTARQVAWSPDGRLLAACSPEAAVPVFAAATGKEELSLKGHRGAILAVAWSADGKYLASGSADGTLKVWDAAAGKEAFTLPGGGGAVAALAWRPDGKQLAAALVDV